MSDPQTADPYILELERRADEAIWLFVFLWCVADPCLGIGGIAIAHFCFGVQ